jgi:hypothetical protein
MNYDPVNQEILNKVLSIDKDYIKNNRAIFNRINSYLRPAINHKDISENMIKMSGLTNGYNERMSQPSIDTNYDLHSKFLKPRPDVVDMDDYEKKYEPKIEKEMMPEILSDLEDEKENKGSGKYKKKGRGKVAKHLKIGNDTLARDSYIGLDNLNNEFEKLGKSKKGGARTANPATKGVKKFNKKIVQNMKEEIDSSPFDSEEDSEMSEQENSMTGAVIDKSRKIGAGGRNTYINKLKQIAKDKGITYKDAMVWYSKNK